MKKILFLLLVTIASYGQTLQNPTFGNTTTNTLKIKTPATVTSVNFLPAFDADGITVSKIDPINLGFAKTNQTIVTLNTFADLSTYTGTSETAQIKDIYRGGFFDKYIGSDPVDNGIIFSGSNGSKWKRIIQDKEVKLQWWGVNGIDDNTVQVNQALDFCASNGFKYLNVEGVIIITGRLNDSKNKVLFTGSGYFKNTYKNTYAETNVSPSESKFSGLINKTGKLDKSIDLLKKDQPLKIVVFGNSIAYGGDYNTQNPEGSNYEIVNNQTNENSWYGNFLRQIQKRFYNKNITIANRAIPGFAISAYNEVISDLSPTLKPNWLNSGMTGKTWANIMKDDSPDVIIIEHGMNSGSEYIKYAINFYAVTQGWAKVPEIVFMSTPTLNYIDALGTDYAGLPRIQKIDVGNQQGNLANYYDSYLIDVARIGNIKRYGVDTRNFTFKTKSIQDFAFTNGSGIVSGNLGIPNTGTITIKRNSQTPKFYLNFDFNPSSAFTSFRISTGDSYVIFTPTNVTIYPLTTEFGNQLPNSSASFSLTAGVSKNIKIEYGDFLNVYSGNTLVISSKNSAPVVNVVDEPVIDIQGSTGTSIISNFQYFEAEYTQYKPSLTGSEMWGILGYGTNGNAINHPTLLGVSETYNLAVNEFVDYIYNKSKRTALAQNLNTTLATGNVSTLGMDIGYAIFRNSSNAYSLEGNAANFGIVDQTAGAFRYFVNSTGQTVIGGISPIGSSKLSVIGAFSATGTATALPATLSTELITKGQLDAAVTPGIKRYVALITQSGTSAPVATVLENTLGGTVVWTRDSTGIYSGTLNGAFTNNKTACFLSNASSYSGTPGNPPGLAAASTSNAVQISTIGAGGMTDGAVGGMHLEVRVYP